MSQDIVDDHGTASLASLIEASGATLFDLLCGDPAAAVPVRIVSIHDPTDTIADHRGAVLLAVGTTSDDAIRQVIDEAVAHQASCVVLRGVTALPESLVDRAAKASLVVLAAVDGIPWNQLSTSLTRGLDHELSRRPRDFGAHRQHRDQTLSNLANALDTALDAPVTIEDLNSNVIGFSDDQTRGDVSRHQTILQRAVSSEFKELLQSNGTFKRLYASPEPIVVKVDNAPGAEFPRIAIRIASDQNVLGSIWVATKTPLAEIDAGLLKATASHAAELLDVMNGHGGADADRRQFLLSQLLGDERDARDAVEAMGLLHASCFLITVSLASPQTKDKRPSPEARSLDKLAASLNLLILSSHPQGMAAAVDRHVFGVVPVRADTDVDVAERTIVGLCERFIHRSGITAPVHVVVSQLLASPFDLTRAKMDGVRTAGMMARTASTSPTVSNVVRTDDAFLDVMLMELHDKLLSRRPTVMTPVVRLMEHDEAHGSDLVPSLVAFFRQFGSVTDAAAAVHVHPNTFRYRLRRIGEICDIDVNDHDSRLKAMLELRIRRILD